MKQKLFVLIVVIILFSACSSSKKATKPEAIKISSLKFLDEYTIPYDLKVNGTWVGGLSGLDYDIRNDRYFIISDERSATSPSRFYTASIKINNYKIDTVVFTSVASLKRPDGKVFPSDPINAADPESIRYNPVKNNLIWSNEGNRSVKNGKVNINNPSIYEMNIDGKYMNSFSLPDNMQIHASESGPRVNGVFEGITFDNSFKNLYVSMEEPIYEDGPRADVDAGATIRINKFDMKKRKIIAQYGYKVDAVAHAAKPANAYKINGIPEILWVGNDRLLVIERSFSTGILGSTIKIFLADLSKASNIANIHSLYQNDSYIPVSKKLLLNMDNLGRYIDNVEGVTFGPVLPNGHLSLIFIADNGFDSLEQSQVFLFEVM